MDDPEERARMGRLGRERLETELNWEKSVESLLRAYNTGTSSTTISTA
jgi:glycosyltransferase involved in cell wall biosynthesis